MKSIAWVWRIVVLGVLLSLTCFFIGEKYTFFVVSGIISLAMAVHFLFPEGNTDERT